ncbi:hypothetical protein [Methylacidimicrobium tartarophylax]|uniref:Uncharacterized protein n=1 Tax=Methylacidimicrobium tartarophylax TaxID=1041768 RepID=A0A5E6M8C9_9BACT|nr:hypothetical protein [Methylacidimicrobium tartarophylax]VVM04596.1 hypothetical protein MAMT_00175 [Methylacidimicrobium tartarophylax]
MSGNQVRHLEAFPLRTLGGWIVAVLFLAGVGIAFLSFKNRVARLSMDVAHSEKELVQWKKRNMRVQVSIARASSAVELERRIAAWHLGLVKTSELEVVRMEEGKRPDVLAGTTGRERRRLP